MNIDPPSRPWAVRIVVGLVVVSLFAPAVVSALTYGSSEDTTLQRGTVTSPANGTTVVSVQGYTFQGNTNPKKPARLIGVGERGRTKWVYNSSRGENAWFFDVDPLPNGNLLVTSPRDERTLVYEFNPETRERVWEQRFPFTDTHDVDMLNEQELVVSHMRAWDANRSVSDDRILVYNLTTDEVTWEWYYRNNFPNSTDGGFNADWSHSNDVDPIGEDRFLVSPRNFDQVLVINRTTKAIEMHLGTDDNYSVLNEQHNPDYLVSENGTPTLLVADSGNNRVVEYAYDGGNWTRTWSVGSETLNWPRDADRLPNGNTLVTDTLNHRVLEITPTGEVVWEFYATWGPYDSERVAYGDGSSRGPTIRDLNSSGTYNITGSAGLEAGGGESTDIRSYVRATFAGTVLEDAANEFAVFWGHYAPWFRPVWMSGWDFVSAIAGSILLIGWACSEVTLKSARAYRSLRS